MPKFRRTRSFVVVPRSMAITVMGRPSFQPMPATTAASSPKSLSPCSSMKPSRPHSMISEAVARSAERVSLTTS